MHIYCRFTNIQNFKETCTNKDYADCLKYNVKLLLIWRINNLRRTKNSMILCPKLTRLGWRNSLLINGVYESFLEDKPCDSCTEASSSLPL